MDYRDSSGSFIGQLFITGFLGWVSFSVFIQNLLLLGLS